jgi:hypothetical protein
MPYNNTFTHQLLEICMVGNHTVQATQRKAELTIQFVSWSWDADTITMPQANCMVDPGCR